MSDDNNVDPKEIVELCGKLSSKCIEIFCIILYSFLFVLLLSSLIIIKWTYLSNFDLVLFIFMF